MQLPMFDAKGAPTDFAIRYVKPKYYSVDTDNGMMRYFTYDVHEAIGMWLKHPDAMLVTHW